MIKNLLIIVLILVGVFVGVMYIIRPYLVKQKCWRESYESGMGKFIEKEQVSQSQIYQECLKKNGL